MLVRGGLVVFCEVKTRGGDGFGGGYEAVTWRKRAKLRQLGEAFLLAHRLVPAAVRFDVASVRVRPGYAAEVVAVRGRVPVIRFAGRGDFPVRVGASR